MHQCPSAHYFRLLSWFGQTGKQLLIRREQRTKDNIMEYNIYLKNFMPNYALYYFATAFLSEVMLSFWS